MDAAPQIGFADIESARNSHRMQDMRMRMLSNKHDSGCQCPAEEAAGIKSMRQHALDRFGFKPFGKLKTVEIFFDNVCNLKCRMCASNQSHLWYDEEKELYGTTYSDSKYLKNYTYKELDVSELEEIKVYGGEPLLNKDANDFFGKLLAQAEVSNLDIEMSTNCTVEPLPNVLSVFENCKRLKLNLSIDGYGKLNEFIRSGSKWDQVVSTMNYFENLRKNRVGQTIIVVHSAVSVYNVNLIEELKSFVEKNYPNFLYATQVVQYPVFQSIKNLPIEYKQMIQHTIKDEGILNYMFSEGTDYFGHFVNFHNKLNKIRSEKLGTSNSVLQDYIDRYTVNVDSTRFFIDCIEKLKGL
jgi:sulfatase maturation enzyme AslB (radical SAM superfamily)